jgi:hypothetical protein
MWEEQRKKGGMSTGERAEVRIKNRVDRKCSKIIHGKEAKKIRGNSSPCKALCNIAYNTVKATITPENTRVSAALQRTPCSTTNMTERPVVLWERVSPENDGAVISDPPSSSPTMHLLPTKYALIVTVELNENALPPPSPPRTTALIMPGSADSPPRKALITGV